VPELNGEVCKMKNHKRMKKQKSQPTTPLEIKVPDTLRWEDLYCPDCGGRQCIQARATQPVYFDIMEIDSRGLLLEEEYSDTGDPYDWEYFCYNCGGDVDLYNVYKESAERYKTRIEQVSKESEETIPF
jgi:hypothetical protein